MENITGKAKIDDEIFGDKLYNFRSSATILGDLTKLYMLIKVYSRHLGYFLVNIVVM